MNFVSITKVYSPARGSANRTPLSKVQNASLRGGLDLKKKYLLACVAYLVGGGMHSCDEVFFTGGKAGMKYTPGKYLDMLPSSFLQSEVGQKWKDEFWEIVRPDRQSPR
jgi:hypothetical protein